MASNKQIDLYPRRKSRFIAVLTACLFIAGCGGNVGSQRRIAHTSSGNVDIKNVDIKNNYAAQQNTYEESKATALESKGTESNTNEVQKSTSSKTSDPIQVIKKPLYIQKGVFIEKQNLHAFKGLTEWVFHCYPEFKYNVESNPFSPNQVTVTITKVKLTISCPVTVRVGNSQHAKTVEHEDGHVQLVKQVYDTAEPIAREAAREVLGKQFHGKGANSDEALVDALDQAGRQIGKYYNDRTVLVANELSTNFDDITNHGNSPISVQQAILLSTKKHSGAK